MRTCASASRSAGLAASASAIAPVCSPVITAAAWRGRVERDRGDKRDCTAREIAAETRRAADRLEPDRRGRARRSSRRLPRTSAASSSRALARRPRRSPPAPRFGESPRVDPGTRGAAIGGDAEGERHPDHLAGGLDLGRDLVRCRSRPPLSPRRPAATAAPSSSSPISPQEAPVRPRTGKTIAIGSPASSAASSATPCSPSPASSAESIREWRSRIAPAPAPVEARPAAVRAGLASGRGHRPLRRRPRPRCVLGGLPRPPRLCGSGSPPRRGSRRSSRRRRRRCARA